MPEDREEQEGNDATPGPEDNSLNNGAPDKMEPDDTDADGQPNPPEHENGVREPVPITPETPWDVVEVMESIPDAADPHAYFYFNGNPIVIASGGFWGKHEGNIQKMPIHVLR